jgi:hypothetical protein
MRGEIEEFNKRQSARDLILKIGVIQAKAALSLTPSPRSTSGGMRRPGSPPGGSNFTTSAPKSNNFAAPRRSGMAA